MKLNNNKKKSNTLSEKVVNPQLIMMFDLDYFFFFFFFFQQTVPQYNQEHMSIDNMHSKSVGIFVYKMACDVVSHSQNRAIHICELI